MARTLVNIISAQTIPNYIFIKDFYKDEDSLLFFTSSTMTKPLKYILDTLGLSDKDVEIQQLTEENWQVMCQEIASVIKPNVNYLVNTTGGTKYMSMAVSEEFHKHPNADFYYIPYPKNIYLKTSENAIPIKHRINIKEYMGITKGVEYTVKQCVEKRDYVYAFFKHYINMSQNELMILDKIRTNFRNQKFEIEDIEAVCKQPTSIVKNPGTKKEKHYDFEQIDGLNVLLDKIQFPNAESNKLNSKEIEFLTGGWYEEYMYYLIEDKIQPDDIALGVFIKQSENTNTNDLDVVFTKGNKLFVIECKTAITKTQFKGVEAMFKEISYKSATLKATLLGLPSNSYICSLSESDESFKKIAQKMGIIYYDRSYFTDSTKQDSFISDIIKQAF